MYIITETAESNRTCRATDGGKSVENVGSEPAKCGVTHESGLSVRIIHRRGRVPEKYSQNG